MRPAFQPTDEQRYSVNLMASIGTPQESIAQALEISHVTLRKYFAHELATGRVRTIAKVADSLVRQALAGNMTAAIFFLKTQGGWRDSLESPAGKKEQAQEAAVTASKGTAWDDLLKPAALQ